jgi:hypothetical protein
MCARIRVLRSGSTYHVAERVLGTLRVREQRAHLVAQLDIVTAGSFEEFRAVGLGQLARLCEQRLDLFPPTSAIHRPER